MKVKIKITKDGDLKMLRRGDWLSMICPFADRIAECSCGDWCPLFHYRETLTNGEGSAVLKELYLCKTRYLIEEIEWEK